MIIRNLTALFVFITVAFSAILGIDFGQDFTKSALIAPGVPFEIVLSADSKRKEPSGLALKKLGEDEIERIYGSATTSHCTRFPGSCLLNLKPLLGKSVDDLEVQHYISSHPGVKIVPSKNNRNTIAFDVDGHQYPLEEIIAMSFQNIVVRASNTLKEKVPGGYSQVNDVVITIPSYFTQAQRNALKDSAELAGLKVVGLVDDGLAIAINYATNREITKDKEYHVIYDMGAGSTTATLVSFTKNGTEPLSIKVEGYAHDESLGGSLFTNAISEIIKNKFLESNPSIRTSSLQSNDRALAKILQAAERAKLVLSANNDASVSIESLYEDIDFRGKISRDEFEEHVSDISKRITKPILDVLETQFTEESPIEFKDISSVIYAGGSTRVPFVQKHLLSLIGEDLVSKTINADESAVVGATLRGVQLSKMFKTKELNISEASVFNYEISYGSSGQEVVFPKGSKYDQLKEVELSGLFNATDDFIISIYEDSKQYGHYDASNVATLVEKLDFNSSECSTGFKIFGKFKLSESRVFTLENVQARCAGPSSEEEKLEESSGGFFDKFKGKKTDSEDSNDDSQNVLKKISNLKISIPTKFKYSTSRPLGSASKQDLRAHLQSLNAKDHQRRQRSEKLNELEAILYKVRAFLEEDEVVEKGPKAIVEEASTKVSELLEWLDYDSDEATTKEIKTKIDEVRQYHKQIEEYLQQLDIPLDQEAFKELHNQGVLALNSIQDLMLTMGETATSFLRNFTEVGLDFEKESKRLKLKSPSFTQAQIESTTQELVKTFEEVKDVFEDPKHFAKQTREELFKLRTIALEKIEKVNLIKQNLQSVHSQRVKELNGVLQRFYRAQKRAAAKAASKLKEEEEKLKDQATSTEEPESVNESTSSTATESETSTEIEHDEL